MSAGSSSLERAHILGPHEEICADELSINSSDQIASCGIMFLLLMGFAQTGFAQTTPPLNFENSYFVTGDYGVAGATDITQAFAGDILPRRQ
jgi:hypothetical protein